MNNNQFYLAEDLSSTKLSQALLSLGKKIFRGQGESKSLAFSTEPLHAHSRHYRDIECRDLKFNATPLASTSHEN